MKVKCDAEAQVKIKVAVDAKLRLDGLEGLIQMFSLLQAIGFIGDTEAPKIEEKADSDAGKDSPVDETPPAD